MTSLAPRKCLPLPVFRSQLAECPANVRAQVDVVQIVLHDVCAVVVPGRRDLQVMVKHLSANCPTRLGGRAGRRDGRARLWLEPDPSAG